MEDNIFRHDQKDLIQVVFKLSKKIDITTMDFKKHRFTIGI